MIPLWTIAEVAIAVRQIPGVLHCISISLTPHVDTGKNRQEDSGAMIRRYPLWNQYWEDKSAKLTQIEVPVYALSSFSTMLHTEGSIKGFLFSASKDKWSVPVPKWCHNRF
jgi:predicted acyl esterase